jgi:hypothetical protein
MLMDSTRCSALFLTKPGFYQRSAYDASYLELAMRRGLPFATKDEPLRKAAEEIGVGIYQP